jgi:hypothetical protein
LTPRPAMILWVQAIKPVLGVEQMFKKILDYYSYYDIAFNKRRLNISGDDLIFKLRSFAVIVGFLIVFPMFISAYTKYFLWWIN